MMKYLFFFLCLPLALFAKEIPEEQSFPVVSYAEHKLAHFGTLQKEKNGFTYLKVDDNYIHELFALLKEHGLAQDYEKPPNFRRPDAPGAHISVLYSDEVKMLDGVPKIGQVFEFQIIGLAKVSARYKQYIVLQIKSLELEAYRKALGLSPLLKNHEFHISIAIKKIGKSH